MVFKDQKKVDMGSKNVASNKAMPMHFDGIFRFRTTRIMTAIGMEYRFKIFQGKLCIVYPAPR